MKFTFAFLLISLSGTINISSQSIGDSSAYINGIRLMDIANSRDNYVEAAHYFEQLAAKSTGQWLALYYAGLSYIHASYKAEGDIEKDKLIDKAQPLIDRAFKLKPEESEIHVLQAFLFQSRMQVNPTMRGLTYSQKADASLKKAVAVNPSNPRAYSLMAYNIYYTPAMFGGGAKKALPLFIKARDKYLAYTPDLPFMPSWGQKENHEMINTCKKAAN